MIGQMDEVHPYFRAILEMFAEAGRPSFHEVSPEEAREMLRAGTRAAPPQVVPHLASVQNQTIPGPNGDIPIRRYLPQGDVNGACVYLHSGGWVIGDLEFCDATCRRFAAVSQCEIISVDYRLAPEHPFPAPLDDAYAALEWAVGETSGPLAIMGESAGGNLAAACAIRARDNDGPVLVGQVLAYPVMDHDFGTESYRNLGSRNWMLSTADMEWFWDQYCPIGIGRDDPMLSPLHVKDATGLPPAFISVAELDPLRDEGLAFARLLEEAGVEVVSRRDQEMLHGYFNAAGAIALAMEALEGSAHWLKQKMR